MADLTERSDQVESLVPIDDVVRDPQAEFADSEALFDDAIDLDEFVVTEEDVSPLGRSWAFDFAARRFKSRAPTHGPLATTGIETLTTWVEKALRTERGAHAIYPDDYGMRDPVGLIGQPVALAATSDYETRVIEALTFHPRIATVRDFNLSLDQENESVQYGFTVVLDDDEEVVLNVEVP